LGGKGILLSNNKRKERSIARGGKLTEKRRINRKELIVPCINKRTGGGGEKGFGGKE